MINETNELTNEQTQEILRLMTAQTNQYKILLNYLVQAARQMKEWKTFWCELESHVDQLNTEQDIMCRFLDVKDLRQQYIDFANSELAQLRLKVVEGGKGNDESD
ncbi:hypothetical protein [Sporomusa acidovorans]|uniref:Uncharacterized protein n=1 Tax=Sporomusa acidovorans (strain ATCC 49682 / DSM 3132 / Mol) TaxID=1123286 RepID=A0ABZ3IYB2_SPOA4|nr:hypothetical protein [Sporomusa acidovorans]OZC22083.1 hypothetical protein SPACI_16010 [Sporomusa acidovorans DSM 3132]SDF66005.1 hypothetical protein SAMN04488499_10668 [Sporomusa acidovorans]